MPADDDQSRKPGWSPPPEQPDASAGPSAPQQEPGRGASLPPYREGTAPQPPVHGSSPHPGAQPYGGGSGSGASPGDGGGTGYGQPPYGGDGPYGYSPGAYPRPRNTNGFAIASMVLGILGILFDWAFGIGMIGAILALIFGYVARKQIREHGDSGGGMAIAGIVLGWIAVAFFVLFIVFLVIGITASHTTGGFAT
jgi:hypothetical protein